jgi:Na+-driven multidrug efflux pump
MAVEGVALATIISQYVSAIVVVIILIKRVDTPYALDPKKLGINYEILKKILLLGLPAGLQGTRRPSHRRGNGKDQGHPSGGS